MSSFEISIPSDSTGAVQMSLHVEAANWMEALRTGLGELGIEWRATDAICDIQPNGVIRVTDRSSGKAFVVKPVTEAAVEPKAAEEPAGGEPDTEREPASRKPEMTPAYGSEIPDELANPPNGRQPVIQQEPTVLVMTPLKPRGKTTRPNQAAFAPKSPAESPSSDTSLQKPKPTAGDTGGELDRAPEEAAVLRSQATRLEAPPDRPAVPMVSKLRQLTDPIGSSGADAAAPQPRNEVVEASRIEMLRVFWETVADIARSRLNAEQVIDACMNLIKGQITCGSIQFLLPSPDHRRLRVAAAHGDLSPDLQGSLLVVDSWFADLVAEREGPIPLVDLDTVLGYTRRSRRDIRYTVDSALWTPMRHRGRLIAVLLLMNSDSEDGFRDSELRALEHLAETLSNTLAVHL